MNIKPVNLYTEFDKFMVFMHSKSIEAERNKMLDHFMKHKNISDLELAKVELILAVAGGFIKRETENCLSKSTRADDPVEHEDLVYISNFVSKTKMLLDVFTSDNSKATLIKKAVPNITNIELKFIFLT